MRETVDGTKHRTLYVGWNPMDSGGSDEKDVRYERWIPQAAVLAHPRVRAFVSHCGATSVNEAIYHKVPIIALPFFHDQVSPCGLPFPPLLPLSLPCSLSLPPSPSLSLPLSLPPSLRLTPSLVTAAIPRKEGRGHWRSDGVLDEGHLRAEGGEGGHCGGADLRPGEGDPERPLRPNQGLSRSREDRPAGRAPH